VDTQRLDLGVLSSIAAEAFGEPGQRTFRLLLETSEGQVSLWLEKEQIVMLGSAIGELMERVPGRRGASPESDTLGRFTGQLDVSAGSLTVGYDPAHNGFTVEASDFSSPFDLTSISCLVARDQFTRVRDQIAEIVAASRPRCSLCGTPLTGGSHFCPGSNGHAHLAARD
jgi:uncharacterized repeat protein (TIGR03847 family)